MPNLNPLVGSAVSRFMPHCLSSVGLTSDLSGTAILGTAGVGDADAVALSNAEFEPAGGVGRQQVHAPLLEQRAIDLRSEWYRNPRYSRRRGCGCRCPEQCRI